MSDHARVLIADDHPLYREGVAHSLDSEPSFVVVGQAGTGDEATRLTVELQPDLVVLDLDMPEGGGIETTARIAARCPTVAILILTVSDDRSSLIAALQAGARGYVLKGIGADELVRAVKAVFDGHVHVSPSLAGEILQEMTRGTPKDPFDQLTDREQEILLLLAKGLTNKEIGESLYLSEKTVKHYMTSVLHKLHVRSRLEAALLAQRRELER